MHITPKHIKYPTIRLIQVLIQSYGQWTFIHGIFYTLKLLTLSCLEDTNPEDSAPFKDLYDCYQGFCTSEGNKRCFPKKEFRSILENEGITIENSSKHANQLRVFGVKYEVVYE